MSGVVFLDTETTGLEPDRHEIWEAAFILPTGEEITYHVPPDLTTASSDSLRLMHFYERTNARGWKWDVPALDRRYIASRIAAFTEGQHLVAAVPSFDAPFLAKFLRANGYREAWHYHLVDVEALAAGKRGLAPPWDSEELSRAVGVDPDAFERHTALGDARWAKAIYEATVR